MGHTVSTAPPLVATAPSQTPARGTPINRTSSFFKTLDMDISMLDDLRPIISSNNTLTQGTVVSLDPNTQPLNIPQTELRTRATLRLITDTLRDNMDLLLKPTLKRLLEK